MEITPEIKKEILLFLLTFVGAFALYLFSRSRGIKPFSIFHAININVSKKAKPKVILCDAIFTSLLGALLGYVVTQPSTNAQAVAAGLGFVGIINSFGAINE
jgi:uncharacterized membrane protein